MQLQGGKEGMRQWTLQLSPWKDIICTVYCTCLSSDTCLNPFKTGDVNQDEVEEEEEANVENDEETDHLDLAFGSDDEWVWSLSMYTHLNTLILKMQLLFY